MSKLRTALGLLKDPGELIIGLDSNGLTRWMSDRMFARISFRGIMGEKLNLDHPKTFNEKLQWLKVYDHNPEYTELVDKLSAKHVVGERIGVQHIVPLLGTWDDAAKIDFAHLPSSFVLKCNHDQGSVILVQDKSGLDRSFVVKTLNRKLKHNTHTSIFNPGYLLKNTWARISLTISFTALTVNRSFCTVVKA